MEALDAMLQSFTENPVVVEQTKKISVDFNIAYEVLEYLLNKKSIFSLYDWQVKCLSACRSHDDNIILFLPTSGGKTLICEILILHYLLHRQQDAIFVLPFVSIVQEKFRDLHDVASKFDFYCEEYAAHKGKIPPVKRRKRKSLYVCTIEKANVLVDSLFQMDRMKGIGLIVIDEVHMLGEHNRGPVLETLITKILIGRFVSHKCNSKIFAMSATLSNHIDLQKFMKAKLLHYDFRPIELKEYVKINERVYKIVRGNDFVSYEFSRVLDYKYTDMMKKKDPEQIVGLLSEVIPGASCLIFCPTRKHCEALTEFIADNLPVALKKFRHSHRGDVLRALKTEAEFLCPILAKTVPYGVAYHHSGLTVEERRILEDGFSSGALCVLICTTTLSAGVNLPAQRVIIRAPYSGMKPLTRAQYMQMSGRAGRAGFTNTGDCYLFADDIESIIKQLFDQNETNEYCRSALLLNQTYLSSFIVDMLSLEFVTDYTSLLSIFNYTLSALQNAYTEIEKSVNHCLEVLKKMDIIKSVNEKVLTITVFGKAAFSGRVSPEIAVKLYNDLINALNGLVLSSYLHLLFIITPYDQVFPFSWSIFYSQYSKLDPINVKTCEICAQVTESQIASYIGRGDDTNAPEKIRRLMLALMLHDVWQEMSVWQVAEVYGVARGFIQSLLQSASSFAYSVLRFSENFAELWPYTHIFPVFIQRLAHCVTPELLPLMELPGVRRARARQLWLNGYRTLKDIANAKPENLLVAIDYLSRRLAVQMIKAARIIIRNQAEDLEAEASELLQQLN